VAIKTLWIGTAVPESKKTAQATAPFFFEGIPY
jgi:hypothetical protein